MQTRYWLRGSGALAVVGALFMSNPAAAVSQGKEITIQQAKGLAAIEVDGQWTCSGALVSDPQGKAQFVLTAAACVPDNRDKVKVRFGSNDPTVEGTSFKAEVFEHEDWEVSDPAQHNIAVLRLDSPVASELATPLQLDKQGLGPSTTAHLMGWGKQNATDTPPSPIQQAPITLSEPQRCMDHGIFLADKTNHCLVGDNSAIACEGDLGAPVSDGKTLYALTATYSNVCEANSKNIAVLLNIKPYIAWIEDKMEL